MSLLKLDFDNNYECGRTQMQFQEASGVIKSD